MRKARLRSATINYARSDVMAYARYGGVVAFRLEHLTFEGWIFHETLIEGILMASSYRMDIPCPNVSSRSWNVVSVRSTDQANTAPLKGEQKFAVLAWLLCEIQIRYEYLVSTIT